MVWRCDAVKRLIFNSNVNAVDYVFVGQGTDSQSMILSCPLCAQPVVLRLGESPAHSCSGMHINKLTLKGNGC
jgi:hypothetical protein